MHAVHLDSSTTHVTTISSRLGYSRTNARGSLHSHSNRKKMHWRSATTSGSGRLGESEANIEIHHGRYIGIDPGDDVEKLLVWVPQLQVKMRDGGRAIEFSDVTQFLYSQWRVALDDEAMPDVKVQAGQWSLDAIAAQLAVLHSAQPDRSPVGLTRALIIAEDALARLDEAALEVFVLKPDRYVVGMLARSTVVAGKIKWTAAILEEIDEMMAMTFADLIDDAGGAQALQAYLAHAPGSNGRKGKETAVYGTESPLSTFVLEVRQLYSLSDGSLPSRLDVAAASLGAALRRMTVPAILRGYELPGAKRAVFLAKLVQHAVSEEVPPLIENQMGRDALTKDRALGELTATCMFLVGAPNLLAAQTAVTTLQRELSTAVSFYAHSLLELESALEEGHGAWLRLPAATDMPFTARMSALLARVSEARAGAPRGSVPAGAGYPALAHGEAPGGPLVTRGGQWALRFRDAKQEPTALGILQDAVAKVDAGESEMDVLELMRTGKSASHPARGTCAIIRAALAGKLQLGLLDPKLANLSAALAREGIMFGRFFSKARSKDGATVPAALAGLDLTDFRDGMRKPAAEWGESVNIITQVLIPIWRKLNCLDDKAGTLTGEQAYADPSLMARSIPLIQLWETLMNLPKGDPEARTSAKCKAALDWACEHVGVDAESTTVIMAGLARRWRSLWREVGAALEVASDADNPQAVMPFVIHYDDSVGASEWSRLRDATEQSIAQRLARTVQGQKCTAVGPGLAALATILRPAAKEPRGESFADKRKRLKAEAAAAKESPSTPTAEKEPPAKRLKSPKTDTKAKTIAGGPAAGKATGWTASRADGTLTFKDDEGEAAGAYDLKAFEAENPGKCPEFHLCPPKCATICKNVDAAHVKTAHGEKLKGYSKFNVKARAGLTLALAAAAVDVTTPMAAGGGVAAHESASGAGERQMVVSLAPLSQRVETMAGLRASVRSLGQRGSTMVQLLDAGREGTYWRDADCVCDGGVSFVPGGEGAGGSGVAAEDFCQCAWTTVGPVVGASEFWRWSAQDVVGGVRRPLADPFAPDGIAIGDASHSWGRAYKNAGSAQVVLHVDLKPPPAGSPFLHYHGDALDVAFTRRWRWLKAHPSCDDTGVKTLEGSPGKRSLRDKTADGRVWDGCKSCLLWWCVPVVESVLVEQPESIWHLMYPEVQEFLQSVEFKDHGVYRSKVWRLATRGLPKFHPTKVLQVYTSLHSSVTDRDPVARSEARSRSPDEVTLALVQQEIEAAGTSRVERSVTPVFSVEVQRMAARYAAAGAAGVQCPAGQPDIFWRLPADFAHATVTPPPGGCRHVLGGKASAAATVASAAAGLSTAQQLKLRAVRFADPLLVSQGQLAELAAARRPTADATTKVSGSAGADDAPGQAPPRLSPTPWARTRSPWAHLVVKGRRTDSIDVGRRWQHGQRADKWGNDFVMIDASDAERARVVHEHAKQLLGQGSGAAAIAAAREQLRGHTLSCHCAPQACHADALAYAANCSEAELQAACDWFKGTPEVRSARLPPSPLPPCALCLCPPMLTPGGRDWGRRARAPRGRAEGVSTKLLSPDAIRVRRCRHVVPSPMGTALRQRHAVPALRSRSEGVGTECPHR